MSPGYVDLSSVFGETFSDHQSSKMLGHSASKESVGEDEDLHAIAPSSDEGNSPGKTEVFRKYEGHDDKVEVMTILSFIYASLS